jgi:hypothetical protein
LRPCENFTGVCVFTQFGEPLIDLTQEPSQVWIGIVRPLSMHYGVFDERRVVTVTELPVLLPRSENQESE